MNQEEQRRLDSRLAGLSREEVNRLYKHASAMRKRIPLREGVRRASLDDLVLRILEEESPRGKHREVESGTVVWVGPQTARIRLPQGHPAPHFNSSPAPHCDSSPTSQPVDREVRLAGHRPAVGDEVAIGLADDGRTWQLASICDRRTKLSRPDVDNRHLERVIVANVDIVCVVVSVVAPPLHPRIVDRYLIAIQRGGAQAVLCVNKVDLLDRTDLSDLPDLSDLVDAELAKLDPYRPLDLPIFLCSASNGQGIAPLRKALIGKTAAFVGHSGVGKSSIMNAIFPSLNLDTGELMGGYGRGAHTTTTSSLHEFSDGTRLIDTPGVRSFGLGKLTREELQWHFPEFEPFRCRFRDCSHDHEPGCEVRNAAQRGAVHPARYDTYLRLLNDA